MQHRMMVMSQTSYNKDSERRKQYKINKVKNNFRKLRASDEIIPFWIFIINFRVIRFQIYEFRFLSSEYPIPLPGTSPVSEYPIPPLGYFPCFRVPHPPFGVLPLFQGKRGFSFILSTCLSSTCQLKEVNPLHPRNQRLENSEFRVQSYDF